MVYTKSILNITFVLLWFINCMLWYEVQIIIISGWTRIQKVQKYRGALIHRGRDLNEPGYCKWLDSGQMEYERVCILMGPGSGRDIRLIGARDMDSLGPVIRRTRVWRAQDPDWSSYGGAQDRARIEIRKCPESGIWVAKGPGRDHIQDGMDSKGWVSEWVGIWKAQNLKPRGAQLTGEEEEQVKEYCIWRGQVMKLKSLVPSCSMMIDYNYSYYSCNRLPCCNYE